MPGDPVVKIVVVIVNSQDLFVIEAGGVIVQDADVAVEVIVNVPGVASAERKI